MSGPPIPRVPASDPTSHTLGAAPSRLTSLRALLPPRLLPIVLSKVRGARASTRPLLSKTGSGGLGVRFIPKRVGRPPAPAVAGPIFLWNSFGEYVCCISHLMPLPSLIFTSLFFGSIDPFSSPFPAVAFFCANPLDSGRQYYFSVYLAHRLSGRAVRLTLSK